MDHQSSLIDSENVINLLTQPIVIANRECPSAVFWGRFKKVFEVCRIFMPIRRQLNQDGNQQLFEMIGTFQKMPKVIPGIFDLFHMCAIATVSGRNKNHPEQPIARYQKFQLGHFVKSIVDLLRNKMGSVVS